MLWISRTRKFNRITWLLLIAGMTAACSSNKVKTQSIVEIAQGLIKEQQLRPGFREDKVVTLRYIVPGKAVIGREMPVVLEIISTRDLPEVTLAFNPSSHVHFKNKWLVLSQNMIVRKICNLKANRIHKETVVLIPDSEGLVKMDAYALYQLDKQRVAKSISVSFSIGNILKKTVNQ